MPSDVRTLAPHHLGCLNSQAWSPLKEVQSRAPWSGWVLLLAGNTPGAQPSAPVLPGMYRGQQQGLPKISPQEAQKAMGTDTPRSQQSPRVIHCL